VNGNPAGGGGWTGVLVAWRSGLERIADGGWTMQSGRARVRARHLQGLRPSRTVQRNFSLREPGSAGGNNGTGL